MRCFGILRNVVFLKIWSYFEEFGHFGEFDPFEMFGHLGEFGNFKIVWIFRFFEAFSIF